jgi:hypothetical protein
MPRIAELFLYFSKKAHPNVFFEEKEILKMRKQANLAGSIFETYSPREKIVLVRLLAKPGRNQHTPQENTKPDTAVFELGAEKNLRYANTPGFAQRFSLRTRKSCAHESTTLRRKNLHCFTITAKLLGNSGLSL